MTPETHRFADDGAIPNSPLPVLVYHGVEDSEARFARNDWTRFAMSFRTGRPLASAALRGQLLTEGRA